MQSADGRFVMWLQTDGNLVEYAVGGGRLLPRWATHTTGGWVLWMQGDGNAVLYSQLGTPLWASGTGGQPGSALYLQTDANLVVYTASWHPIFATGTQPPPYQLKNANSGLCLFLDTAVTLKPCNVHAGNEVLWLNRVAEDQYALRSAFTTEPDVCLNVPGGSPSEVQLQGTRCALSVTEVFRWTGVGPFGRGALTTTTSTVSPFNCVGIAGASGADGAAVEQQPCSGATDQLWDLVAWDWSYL